MKNLTLQNRPNSLNEVFAAERQRMLEAVDAKWLEYEAICVEEGTDPTLTEFYQLLVNTTPTNG